MKLKQTKDHQVFAAGDVLRPSRATCMIALFCQLLALGALVICPATANAQDSPSRYSGDGVIELSIQLCDFLPKHFAGGTLRYTISGPSGVVAQKAFNWDSNDSGVLHWSAQVPPGVYEYSVQGLVKPDALPCGTEGYLAVLPGSVRRVNGGMHGGIGDPLVPLFIYGTLPEGINAAVVRLYGASGCGSVILSSGGVPIDVSRDSIGFYAQDYPVSSEAEAVFGIRVQMSKGNSRIFRVVGHYPTGNIAVPPTAVRFDISHAMIEAAFLKPADKLVCMSEDESSRAKLILASYRDEGGNQAPPSARVSRSK